MAESTSSGERIRFGPFELDLCNGELRKHGIRLRLQEQPFKILVALLETPGQVVTREELRKRIWAEGTFVEFDHGLNAAVNRLREVLCDSAEQPRYVETLARRGYRFIAAVEERADTVEPPRPSRRWLWVVAAALAALTAAGAGVWWKARRSALRPMRVAPLTALPGRETAPSFSPDGKQAAFVWDGEGKPNADVYVKMVGSSAPPLRLTTDPLPDVNPVWSPEGSRIAFLRRRGEWSSVLLISPLGGEERKLAEVRHHRLLPVMAWSADGKVLAIGELEPQGTNGIFAYFIDGGERRRLTANRSYADRSPAFSPDGRFLAYAAYSGLYSSDVHLLELGPNLTPKGPPRRLTHQGLDNLGIAWAADERSIIYSASSDAGLYYYLWRVAVSGSAEPERLEIAGRRASNPALSAATKRLAFSQSPLDRDILRWERGGNAPAPFISSTWSEDHAQYSPDGQRIAFASNRSGSGTEIFVCGRDGANLVQLTNGIGRRNGSPRWSPDGRYLVFDSQGADGRFDVYRIDAEGGRPERLTDSPSDDAAPTYSRDGRWIYMTSNRDGRFEIWRMPAGGGVATPITASAATIALESWDGKTVYLQNAESYPPKPSAVMAMPAAGGESRRVLDGVTSRGFVPVKGGLYYVGIMEGGPGLALQFYDDAAKQSRLLTRINTQPILGLTVSPDGKTFLFTVQTPAAGDLMMIENFP